MAKQEFTGKDKYIGSLAKDWKNLEDFTGICLDFIHSFIAYQPRTETVRSGAIKVSRLKFCLLNQSCFDQLSGDNIQKRWLYEGPFNLRQC